MVTTLLSAFILLAMSVGMLQSAAAQSLPATRYGAIIGQLIDDDDSTAVGFAVVHLIELKRGERAHEDGSFHFLDVPAGSFTLRVTRIGYRVTERLVTVRARDTTHVVMTLTSSALQSGGVVVSADRDRDAKSYRPDDVLAGRDLHRSIGTTVGQTLSSEPGVALGSLGPATARPVIRGASGDRVQILEDGASAGDVSSLSPDHAVAIDPVSTERIEIIRGPRAFLFNANAIGGVVNVVRDRLVTNLPDRIHGTISIQGESVNRSAAGAGSLTAPIGPFGFRLQTTGRIANDFQTPDHTLVNSDVKGFAASTAATFFAIGGYAGIGAGVFTSAYGLPVADASEEQARIEMTRRDLFGEGVLVAPDSWMRRSELTVSYIDYVHDELVIGGDIESTWRTKTSNVRLMGHHADVGPISRGTLGASLENLDFEATGVSVPHSQIVNASVFGYEEASFGELSIVGSIRGDGRWTALERIVPETGVEGSRDRSFAGVSGGLEMAYDVGPEVTALIAASRTFRSPDITELYANGLHLASYSYEVGNPELAAESGFGLEGAVRLTSESGSLRVAAYRNAMSNFIYPRRSGRVDSASGTPIYQHAGETATLSGAELNGELALSAALAITAMLSYVDGRFAATGDALPFIPPLAGRLGANYRDGGLAISLVARGSADQRRVGEFETPTSGYVVADAVAEYEIPAATILHTIVVAVDNITNTNYRNHLSRLKDFAPEPGRSFRLLYRAYF